MRIGIDARELCGHPTGVGRHLNGLLGAWASSSAAAMHTFILYSPEPVTTALRHAEVRVVPGSPGTRWEQISLPGASRQDRLDVFFAPGYTAPLRWQVPTVVLVHDISFVAHPEWFAWKEGLRRRMITRWSTRRARLVLTVSHAARQEILSHFGLPESRVRCVYPGVLSLPSSNHAKREPQTPLILFVGSVFNRRHLPELIRAFKPIARSHADARLAIVGDNRTHPHQDLCGIAAAEGIANQVIVRPYAVDRELSQLYGQARVFALLSEYEGFGHPPLEALGSGVPPVLLDTTVAREVCGDAAIYVRLDEPRSITDALERLLFDEAARQRVLREAPAVLGRYSWSRAGAETLDALECAPDD